MNKYRITLNGKEYFYHAANCDGAIDKLSNRMVFGRPLTCNIKLKTYDADTRGGLWATYDVDGNTANVDQV
ncbi:MAG: hypothetical protein ABIL06_13175 [Pseudomonadota bacterium]|uniref:Uncharacterized protein n=1 Tax=viral metagenome TaxID=1070528 RepID=A0A6H1ZHW4_9ZZZZ